MASLCLKWVQYMSYIVDIKLVDSLVLSVLWLSSGMALDKLIMNNFPSLNGKIDDSQCNFRCTATNISKIFCRIHPLGHDNILKMSSSKYSEMTLASQHPLSWATRLLSNRLTRLATKQTKAQHLWFFVVSPHKWVGNAGIVIDIMTVTQHIVMQYGDINQSTLTRVIACWLTEPNHYLNQCWLIIGKVQWQLSEGNLIDDTSAINY